MKHTKLHAPGYMTIDHRMSPGLTDEQIQKSGLPPGAGQGFFEADFVSCSHCQTVVIINPERVRPRGWCSYCDRYLCDVCEGVRQQDGLCRSAAAQIDKIVEEAHKNLNIKEI